MKYSFGGEWNEIQLLAYLLVRCPMGYIMMRTNNNAALSGVKANRKGGEKWEGIASWYQGYHLERSARTDIDSGLPWLVRMALGLTCPT